MKKEYFNVMGKDMVEVFKLSEKEGDEVHAIYKELSYDYFQGKIPFVEFIKRVNEDKRLMKDERKLMFFMYMYGCSVGKDRVMDMIKEGAIKGIKMAIENGELPGAEVKEKGKRKIIN